MAKELLHWYTFSPGAAGAGTVVIKGNYSLNRILLITNVTDSTIIYNFTRTGSLDKGGSALFNSETGETTITLNYDTSSMSSSDELQIFVDQPTTQIEPFGAYKDGVDRFRVGNPQALIDTDFEYSLQPTKWETVNLQNNIPGIYQRANEPAFTGDQIVSIAQTTFTLPPSAATISYDPSVEDLDYTYAFDNPVGGYNDQWVCRTFALRPAVGAAITCIGTVDQNTATTISLTGLNLQQNDVVFYIASYTASNTPVTPTGYTDVFSGTNVNSLSYKVTYKVQGATPDTSLTGLGARNGIAVAFRNVDTTNVIDATDSGAALSSGNNNQPDPPAVTTVTDGACVVACAFVDDDRAENVISPPITFDLINDENRSNGTGTLAAAMFIKPTAGTINPSPFGGRDNADLSNVLTLPFSYEVLGTISSTVRVNAEGVLFFSGGTATTSGLTGRYVTYPHLKVFAQNLNYYGMGVAITGTSPNRVAVVRYKCNNTTVRGNDLSHVAYIKFFESESQIEIHYKKLASAGTTHLGDGTTNVAGYISWSPTTNNTTGTYGVNDGFIVEDAVRISLTSPPKTGLEVVTTQAPTPDFYVGQPVIFKETTDTRNLDRAFIITKLGASSGIGTTSFVVFTNSPETYTGNVNTEYTIIYTGGFYYSSELPVSSVDTVDATTRLKITFSTPHGLYVGSTIYVVDPTASNIEFIGSFEVQRVLSSTEVIINAFRTTTYSGSTTLSTAATKVYVQNNGVPQHRYLDGGVQISPEASSPNCQIIRQTRQYFRYQSGKSIQYSTGILFKPTYDVVNVGISSTSYDADTYPFYDLEIETDQIHGFAVPSEYRVGAGVSLVNFEVVSGPNPYNVPITITSIIDAKRFTAKIGISSDSLPSDESPGGLTRLEVNSWNDAQVRCGLFDTQNGIFLEHDGSNLYAVRRTSTEQLSGTISVTENSAVVTGTNTKFTSQLSKGDYIVIKGVSYLVNNIESDTSLTVSPDYNGRTSSIVKITKTVDYRTKDTNFSIDKLDGTGPSGYTFNPNRMQMVFIDYSWYGAGKIRYGMRGLDGNIFYFHEYLNNNTNTEAYMRSGNVPGRFEIINKGKYGKIQTGFSTTGTSTQILTSDAVDLPTKGTIVINNEYIQYSKGSTSGNNTIINFDNRNTGFLSAGTTSAVYNDDWESYNQNCSPSLSHWGVSVLMDGEFNSDKSYLFTASNSSSITIGSGVTRPLLTVRLSPSVDYGIPGFYGVRNLVNRSILNLNAINVTTSGLMKIEVKINGSSTLFNTESNWQSAGNGSIAQYIDHTTTTAVEGGDVVATFITDEGSNRQASSRFQIDDIRGLSNSILGGPNSFPDGPDTLTIFATNLSSNNRVITSTINWLESQG